MKILKKQYYRSPERKLNDYDTIEITLELDIKTDEWHRFLADNQKNIENWKEFINK
jgi:hypothetical protein